MHTTSRGSRKRPLSSCGIPSSGLIVNKRIYESDDEKPVPHDRVKTQECETGLDEISTTRKYMNKAREDKVFITLIIGIIIFVGSQLMNTRDSSIVQPYVDHEQDARLDRMETDIGDIKDDVKSLLGRASNE